MAMILQEKDSPFEIDTFSSMYEELKKYIVNKYKKYERIVLDHVNTSTFMLSDGVVPTNEGRGYVLRRIIRRAVRAIYRLTGELTSLEFLISVVIEDYKNTYKDLEKNESKIINLFKKEEELFQNTLVKGNQEIISILENKKTLDENDAFYLFETFGFPFELTKETALENGHDIDVEKFNKLFEKHRIKSNSGKKNVSSNKIKGVEKNKFVGYEDISIESEVFHIEKSGSNNIIFTKENPRKHPGEK